MSSRGDRDGLPARSRETNQQSKIAPQTVLAFFEYAYDAEGRRISQTTAEGIERYTYDAVGNRITSGESRSVATETYTANNLNQYTTISGGPTSVSAIEYDLDGNMTRKGDTRYYYDIQNRLVAVTNTTKDIAWSCEYDVFGNRTKVIDHGAAVEGRPPYHSAYRIGGLRW